MYKYRKIFLPVLFLTSFLSHAQIANTSAAKLNSIIKTEDKIYGLRLGSTRVIYNEGMLASSFWIRNEKKYPIIVQSQIFSDDKKSKAPFIITPPVLRLESEIQTRLRIVPVSNVLKQDTESLFWICVKGIPPENISSYDAENNNKSAHININVITNSCIKLLTRPKSVNISVEEANKKLRWDIKDGNLLVENPSPLYINIARITVNGKEVTIPDGYIEPYKSVSNITKASKGDKVNSVVLDDIGSEINNEVTL